MKQNSIFIQFTALLAALYFVVAGIGHNVVDYCCDNCEAVGIEFLAEHSCSEAHHNADTTGNDHHHAGESCCSTEQMPGNGFSDCPVEGECELTRFQLNNFYSFTTAIRLQVPVLELDDIDLSFFNLADWTCWDEKNLYYPPPESCLQSGRLILTLKSVLVI